MLLLGMAAAVAGGGAEAPPKYKDPGQPVMVRVRDLMKRMTLAEKIGQMTQIERFLATPDILNKFAIGNSPSLSLCSRSRSLGISFFLWLPFSFPISLSLSLSLSLS